MKRTIHLLVLACIAVSCGQVKDIAYFQQIDQVQSVLSNVQYDAQIKPKDILTIAVVSSEPDASRRYNLIMPQAIGLQGMGGQYSTQSQPTLQSYLVDIDGNINFPSLGTIRVKGMTTKQLEKHIEDQLKSFFTEELPIITVRFMNYSINVLGEVLNPGKFENNNGRITIFDGLAMAGDMTIYGRRDNVKVLREDESGEIIIYTLNLNDKKLFGSPAYFLQQNDVVYVEPNQTKANSSRYGAAENYRISTLTVLISLATLGISIFSLSK